MFNKNFRKDKHFSASGFRYRGVESSRIEHLTDAVFAFAITLLVIASEVPKTYVELQASMYGFIGFIACLLLLFGIWSNHSLFFLQYGMQDRTTKTLNFLFLFVLLFYIYPLKYLFSHLGSVVLLNTIGEVGLNSDAFLIALEKSKAARLSIDQWQDLIVRFGLGLLLIYSILGLMHVNALTKRKELELNKQEVYETKFHIMNYVVLMSVSAISMIYVMIRGGYHAGDAGCFYLLIPILLPFYKIYHVKKLKQKFPESFSKEESVVAEEEETLTAIDREEIIREAVADVELEKAAEKIREEQKEEEINKKDDSDSEESTKETINQE